MIGLSPAPSGDRTTPGPLPSPAAEVGPNPVKLRGSVYITFHPLNKFDLHHVSRLA